MRNNLQDKIQPGSASKDKDTKKDDDDSDDSDVIDLVSLIEARPGNILQDHNRCEIDSATSGSGFRV